MYMKWKYIQQALERKVLNPIAHNLIDRMTLQARQGQIRALNVN